MIVLVTAPEEAAGVPTGSPGDPHIAASCLHHRTMASWRSDVIPLAGADATFVSGRGWT